jgi:hypothetical protein
VAKELIIPLKMDTSEAQKQLQQFQAAASAAGKTTEEAGKKGKESLDLLGDAAKDVSSMFLGVASAGAAIGAIQGVFSTITSQAKEAAEYVSTQAEKFASMREAMLQIQVLKGQVPSTAGAAELIEKAERTKILTPTEYGAGEKAFQQYGSMYVGREIQQKTVDELLPDVLATAKARGIRPELAAQTLSTIIKGMPAGTGAGDYRRMFMGLMQVAEKSRGSPQATAEAFLTIASENVGEGLAFGPGEKGLQGALRMIGVQQESHMGSAAEYTNDLLRGLRLMAQHKQEAKFGIKAEMTPEEKVAAIYSTYKKSGAKDFARWFAPMAGGRGGDTFIRAMQTAWMSGIEKGAFGEMGGAMATATAQTMPDYLKEFRAGDVGERMESVSGKERAEARIGAEPFEQRWLAAKERAAKELAEERRFTPEGRTWGDVVREKGAAANRMMGFGDAGTVPEMLVRQRALEDIASTDRQRQFIPMAPTEAGARDLAHQFLKQIAENTRQDGRPLSAPPPQRDGQR